MLKYNSGWQLVHTNWTGFVQINQHGLSPGLCSELAQGFSLCWGSVMADLTSPTDGPRQEGASVWANPLLRAGSVRSGFEYLGWRSHPSEKPAPLCDHPQSKTLLSFVWMRFCLCSRVSFVSCSVTGHHWEGSGFQSLRQEFICELSPSWTCPDVSTSRPWQML